MFHTQIGKDPDLARGTPLSKKGDFSMSVIDAVRDLQNQTTRQERADHNRALDDGGNNRNVGGMMGKNDFLKLLSVQLRHQDPLNPQNDSDFAAGLAQFSALEQMQNMNHTLEVMNGFQSYSLVGKFVIAEAIIDGKLTEIPGVLDSIFTSRGVVMAQIGEFAVPVSSIKEVFDTNNILTSEMLLQASNNLIGRTVVAQVDDEDIEGVVTRILVDKGSLIAQIDDGTDEPKFVPVNSIVDIRETGTDKFVPKGPKPEKPPKAVNFKEDGEGGFYETCEAGTTILGRWTWDEKKWEWVYEEYEKNDGKNQAA